MGTDGPAPARRHTFADPVCVMMSASVGPNATEMFVREIERRSGCPVDWNYAGGRIMVKCEAADTTPVVKALEDMRWIWAGIHAARQRLDASGSPSWPRPEDGDWIGASERWHGWDHRA